jgi:hypothetical protein
MHQYLKNALESLSATCNRSALHPLDEDSIKLHLRVLNCHGIQLDAVEIESWLQANEWQNQATQKVVSWAKTIAEGGRVKFKNAHRLQSESEVWKYVQMNSL